MILQKLQLLVIENLLMLQNTVYKTYDKYLNVCKFAIIAITIERCCISIIKKLLMLDVIPQKAIKPWNVFEIKSVNQEVN